jgi:cobalt-zinc-cadmium efflux system membrane fusion protein
MFATVALRSNASAQALLVPEQAVTLYQGHAAVFIESQGGFMPRAVEAGAPIGGKVPIKAGLAPGERVVVAGAYELKARLLKSQFATED